MRYIASFDRNNSEVISRVLIVEPNPYHGVILPGLSNYFRTLGFKVEIILRKEVAEEKPFARFSEKEMPLIRIMTPLNIRNFIKSSEMKKYDFIFFSSNAYWEPGVYLDSYIRFLGVIPHPRICSLFIEHNLSYLSKDDCDLMLADNRVFTLYPFTKNNNPTFMLNPHYFGRTNKTYKNKITRFITVGRIDKSSRDLDSLLNAAKYLEDKKCQFVIDVVGEGALSIPKGLEKHINVRGKITYPDLFDLLDNSDFFLPLLNPLNINHQKYIKETTTGSYLLILGFAIPAIVNDTVGNFYRLSNKNSIMYKEDSLNKAMEKAISLNSGNYESLRLDLLRLSKSISEESLSNLVKVINDKYNEPKFISFFIDFVQLFLANTRKQYDQLSYLTKCLKVKFIKK